MPRDAVVHPFALSPTSDETCPPEVAKVARHGRLDDVQDLAKVANAELTLEQEVQNPQAGRIRKGLEQVRRCVHRRLHVWLSIYVPAPLSSPYLREFISDSASIRTSSQTHGVIVPSSAPRRAVSV